jgi:hypothetical protein
MSELTNKAFDLSSAELAKLHADYARVQAERARLLRESLAPYKDNFISPSSFAVPGDPNLKFNATADARYDCLPLDTGDSRVAQALMLGSMSLESMESAGNRSVPTSRMSLAWTGDPDKDVLLFVPGETLESGGRSLSRVSVLNFAKDRTGQPQPQLVNVVDARYNAVDPAGLVALIPKQTGTA